MSVENQALLASDNRALFEILREETLAAPELRTRLGINASTCARCLGELEHAKLIEFTSGQWRVTAKGKHAYLRYFGS